MPKLKQASRKIKSKEGIELKKKALLLLFTKELILHSGAGEVSKLKNILKEQSEEREESKKLTNIIDEKKEQEFKVNEEKEIKQGIEEEERFKEREKPEEKLEDKSEKKDLLKERLESALKFKGSEIRNQNKEAPKQLEGFKKPIQKQPATLRVPEPRLPPEFQHLRPTPTKQEIDLGKLNPLIQDPAVKTIECEAPDEKIIVTGNMGRKPTNITLTEDEINDVIDKFSEASKIPVNAGVFKVVVGNLILSAIVSEVTNSKFIIRKIPPMNRNQNPSNQNSQ